MATASDWRPSSFPGLYLRGSTSTKTTSSGGHRYWCDHTRFHAVLNVLQATGMVLSRKHEVSLIGAPQDKEVRPHEDRDHHPRPLCVLATARQAPPATDRQVPRP